MLFCCFILVWFFLRSIFFFYLEWYVALELIEKLYVQKLEHKKSVYHTWSDKVNLTLEAKRPGELSLGQNRELCFCAVNTIKVGSERLGGYRCSSLFCMSFLYKSTFWVDMGQPFHNSYLKKMLLFNDNQAMTLSSNQHFHFKKSWN